MKHRGLALAVILGLLMLPVTLSAQGGGRRLSPRALLASKPPIINLKWEYKDLPFKIRTFEAPFTTAKRLFENGTTDAIAKLQPLREFKDGIVRVEGEMLMLYLVIENTTEETIHFAASPHEVHPVTHSFGFNFKCLCFGHVYKAEPKSIWYRIVKLEAHASQAGKTADVVHTVFRVKKTP